jgi:hypothetical protein
MGSSRSNQGAVNAKHPLYRTWVGMRFRCRNPGHAAYGRYGGRGISVCDRWNDFWLFVEDMGERPEGHTLDRIDNDGNYEPENCRWADARSQNRNTILNRIVRGPSGESLTVIEWSEKSGLKYSTILERLKRGWTEEEAVTVPTGGLNRSRKLTEADVKEIRRRRIDGETCNHLGKEYGVSDVSISAISTGKAWKHVD